MRRFLKVAVPGLLAGFMASQASASAALVVCNESAGMKCSHESGVRIKDVSLAGDGCNAGVDANVQFNENGDQIEFSFGGFNATVSPGRIATKNCGITLNLIVPSGISVSLFDVDYSGFALLARGATMDLLRSYTLTDRNNSASANRLTAPKVTIAGRNVYDANSGVSPLEVSWDMKPDTLRLNGANFRSTCGAPVFLRADARIVVKNFSNFDAYASVDRAGIRKKTVMHYGFSANACN